MKRFKAIVGIVGLAVPLALGMTVAAAEDLLIGVVRDHHHLLAFAVGLGTPGVAVAERRLEHREPVAGGEAARQVEGPLVVG